MTDQLSRVFAALADPTRRDMVARLTEGDHTVNDLAAPYDVSLQAVSKHLKVLEDAGLVTRTREAQRRPVHLEAEVFDLMTKWIERYRRQAEERFSRLDAVLARWTSRTTRTTGTLRKEPHHDHHADRRRPATPRPRSRPTSTCPPSTSGATSTPPPRSSSGPTPTPSSSPSGSGRRSVGADITEWDARDGGGWRYTARGIDGREEFETSFRGCFHTVREDRIVQTFTWEGMPDDVALETMTFEDLGDGRTRLHGFSLCDSFEGRDGWLSSGMEVGVTTATPPSTGSSPRARSDGTPRGPGRPPRGGRRGVRPARGADHRLVRAGARRRMDRA